MPSLSAVETMQGMLLGLVCVSSANLLAWTATKCTDFSFLCKELREKVQRQLVRTVSAHLLAGLLQLIEGVLIVLTMRVDALRPERHEQGAAI